MTTQGSSNPTNDYFDLHITGMGYVNRIREVTVKPGTTYWACDINALHGAKEAVHTTRFDCRISGSEAEKLIRRCEQADKDKKKILVGFKLGDLHPETFVYGKGDKTGQIGINLKARLLFIGWIKIEGESVYKAPPKTETPGQYTQAA